MSPWYWPSRAGYVCRTSLTTQDGQTLRFPFPNLPYFHSINWRYAVFRKHHLIICIFRSDITSFSYSYCQHNPVQNNVSEQLVGGDTGPILTASVFFLIAHIHANITYAPVGTIFICWSIWIGVLAVSSQLPGKSHTSPTIAQDIQQKAVTLTVTQRFNECLEKRYIH